MNSYVHNITFVTGLQIKLLKEMLKPNQKKQVKVLQCIFTDEIYMLKTFYPLTSSQHP